MSRRLLAATGTNAAAPDVTDPPGPSTPATRVLNVADWVGGQAEAVITGTRTGRTTHTARLAATNLRVVFGSGQTTTGVLAAAIQINDGPLVPLTFSGSSTAAVASHYARKTSDPAAVTVAPGDTIALRVRYTGDGAWMFAPSRSGVGNSTVAGDSLTGTWPSTGLTDGAPGPLMILGDVVAEAPKSWLQSGDSIVVMGFLNAALDGRAWINFARFGEEVSGASSAVGIGRYGPQPWSYATLAIDEYGTNDLKSPYPLSGGVTAASVLAAWQDGSLNHWRKLASSGMKVYRTTLTPGSSSTDGYATTTNQTPLTYNEVRVPANTWLRDGAPLVGSVPAVAGTTDPTAVRAGEPGHPLKGYIEVADAVESARDSSKWKAPGYTTDGIHPEATATTAMAAAVSAWLTANSL